MKPSALTPAQPWQIRKATPISPSVVGPLVRLFDIGAFGFLGILIYVFYVNSDLSRVGSQYVGALLLALVVVAALFQWFGVYGGDFLFERKLRVERMLLALATSFAVLLAVAFAVKVSSEFSRVWAVSWFAASAMVLSAGRFIFSLRVAALAAEGRFASRTVIVGAGEHGQRLAEHLNAHGDARIRIVGFVDDRADRVPRESHGHRVLGDTERLVEMVRRGEVDQIFVALPWSAEARLRGLVYRLAETPVPIHLAPDFIGFEFADRRFGEVARLPMLNLFERPISGWAQVIKELEDRGLAFLILLFLAPLMGLIALAIKLDSRGPVFFKQVRHGFNNNLIQVLKFRSMYTEMSDADCDVQTTKGDPRVTRVGRFLRASSLDELPQLINVLLGDMSLVGPRPHALSTKAEGRLFEDVVDRYAARHKVKPGITGWAQVNGWRGETDTTEKIQKRVEYDLFYIDNWSVWLDLKILLLTLAVIFKDENAY